MLLIALPDRKQCSIFTFYVWRHQPIEKVHTEALSLKTVPEVRDIMPEVVAMHVLCLVGGFTLHFQNYVVQSRHTLQSYLKETYFVLF